MTVSKQDRYCFGCLPPRAATIVLGLLTFSVNGLLFIKLSCVSLPATTEGGDVDDGGRFKVEAVRALLHAVWLWTLAASIMGIVGVHGGLRGNIRSLRLFALHGLCDTFAMFLCASSIALFAFSARISTSMARIACAELVRGSGAMIGDGQASWFDFSRSAESCEERIGSVVGLVFALSLFILGCRAHCAAIVWRYYTSLVRQTSARHELELVSDVDVKASLRRLSTSSNGSSRTLRQSRSRSSSSDDTVCASPTSSTTRIFLLPPSSPPPSTSTSSGSGKTPARRHTAPSHSNKRASHMHRSSEAEDVLVYAPVRMSMEEAAKMGGREAFWR